MNTFNSVTATNLSSNAALHRKFPLRVTCLGEASLKDNPLYGSSEVLLTIELDQCDTLNDAITCVERIAGQAHIDTGDDEIADFEPLLFIIIDNEQCQVLAGEPVRGGVKWCHPVASDDEARLVMEEASKLRAEASFEAGWDNYNTARRLGIRASVIEGRLVHPDWRQAARMALLKAE
ncbi:hypothetical protein [Phyllobacterium leguminum]|uniref:Uncharacterized protein n=1 Tax=Phyllobacterium leguminum TaxID=314237 RepID=A0A318T1F3_9HYPH|nr:hypothetical protein [Phyllobacterium leguminum]PYE87557.1 hypothetical protein C7477_11258 [Phyllobacterium leguminum]